MDITANLIKYVLFACNFLFVVSGLLMIIFGCGIIFGSDTTNPTNKFLDEHKLVTVGVFLLLLGLSIFCVTFFGCWGAFYEKYSMLYIYGIALSLLLVLQLIFYGIALYLSISNSKEDVVRSKMLSVFSHYNAGKLHNMNIIVDSLQSQYHCCGIDGPADWKKWDPNNWTKLVPTSCCVGSDSNTKCLPTMAYREGCFHPVMDLISSKFKLSYIVLSLVIQIFVIGATFFLAKEISTNRSNYNDI